MMRTIQNQACSRPGCDNFGKPGINIVGHGCFTTKRLVRCNIALVILCVRQRKEVLQSLIRSMLSSGNDALQHFAKAATKYTRSQAHAREVYEALVPQPTSPSDLGLKLFGGDWASWETMVR